MALWSFLANFELYRNPERLNQENLNKLCHEEREYKTYEISVWDMLAQVALDSNANSYC